MNRILITGATGNVGKEVIKHLMINLTDYKVVAGVRKVESDSGQFKDAQVALQHFDFEDHLTFKPALTTCDILFLLRPPQLADIDKHFAPLIMAAQECNTKHIVFLSVQGVQNSPIIPHHKIEKLIVESRIPYTFLRPAYFMQNFTTTLRKDIIEKRHIFLPAGAAKFTIIDTVDIGTVSAVVLTNPDTHINKAYDLTNQEKLTFEEMATKISTLTGNRINYVSPNLLRFFIQKRKEGVPVMYILVLILLHYVPRFRKEPVISDWVYQLTGKQPRTFDEFLTENKPLLV